MHRLLNLYNRPNNLLCRRFASMRKVNSYWKIPDTPDPMKPGQTQKYDYEYRHRGKCNIFIAVEPKVGRHHIRATNQKTQKDFVQFMKWLFDKRC